ncbi:MAG: hypothetical protein ACI97A_000503 [Planctomycetota bacterium]|jgi:hypothetical protein
MFATSTVIPKLCLWFLGGWLFLSISMAYIAGSTFVSLKPETLRNANVVFDAVEAKTARPQALRYIASELNRRFFRHYGVFQCVVGALTLLLVFLTQKRAAFFMVLCAFALALFFHFHLIPNATELGREIDFTPKEPVTAARESFDALHRMSTRSEGLKMLLILGASSFVMRSKAPQGNS